MNVVIYLSLTLLVFDYPIEINTYNKPHLCHPEKSLQLQ